VQVDTFLKLRVHAGALYVAGFGGG
jgi:hypothetical protein